MSSGENKKTKKIFIIKTYPNLSEIRKVIKNIAQKMEVPLQISILGKITTRKTLTKKEVEKIIADIKKQLRDILGKEFEFGYFYNPELGSLFIAGHLTPVFLNKVNKKELASLPAGLAGIFRGLGIDAKEFKSYFSALKNDNYCLIIRGRSSELAAIEALLT
ncbi:hypothetical protein K8354_18080 [Polaribacter litorisediminis]|uniref:hypothetical protein n=1 Tax=Polaribacter litorisediminis TaxID=1908341 RepID=UPI001CBFF618|nr:hypothetical protein [Polaribacter litorisediminis]UAM98159.1 hypothetical protein K8354_18080 [Polaribacter litorisediminis]